MKRAIEVAALVIASAAVLGSTFLMAGCEDRTTVVIPPDEGGCPFTLVATPVASFPGLYAIEPSTPGAFEISVNGTNVSVEFGGLARAMSGDTIQGCREQCCTRSIVLP